MIANVPISLLIDTGASVSLCSFEFFNKISNKIPLHSFTVNVNVKSISGNDIDIIGCFSLPLQLGNQTINHKFFVVQNSFGNLYDAILGFDFLKSHRFNISFMNDTLTFNNFSIPMRDALSKSKVINSTNYARLSHKFTLQPYETRQISLKMDFPSENVQNILFESVLRNPQIQLINGICHVNKNNISVEISNLSSSKIPFNKNMRFGVVSSDFDTRDIDYLKYLRQAELQESDFNLDHLDANTRKQFLELFFEFSDIFSKRLYTIGRTTAIQPNLTVDTSNLPSIRPYRIPHALQTELKKQLDELELANIIEKSNSHISFPLIMVKKKNPSGDPTQQQWRLVIDYRHLNKNLKYPRYRLPVINQLLENLRGSRYFSCIDLHSSFWQIPLNPKDRDITTFSTQFGSYRYVTTPQGLSSSPEVFCQLADQILAPLSDLKISNYLDDFCCGAQNVSDMIYTLRKLFERFREFGLTLNPSKCSFFLPEVQFLGHKLNSSVIKPTDENIRKIKDFPVPNTVKKIRRFVGLASYYSRFINHFSQLSAPLTSLTRKNQKFKWNADAQKSFEIIKEKLSEPPVLVHPDYNKQFILSCDASNISLGAMLGQRDDHGIIHPISYFSKKLNDAQLNYTIMEKELLAIVEAVKSFRYYLYGRKFIIRCDNSALTKLSNLGSHNSRVIRWFAILSDYNYDFELIKSSENLAADLFSRDFHVNMVQIDIPTLDQIREAQHNDTKLNEIITHISNESISSSKYDDFKLINGLLMHTAFISRSGKSKKIEQIVVPDKYKPHILAANHMAHFGVKKTYDLIREKFFWDKMYSDTKNYVESCKHCISYKSPNKIPPVPIQRNFIPTRPMEFVSCDFIGKLKQTNNGNSYILSFIDHFTKFMKLYAVPDQSAVTTSEKFLDFICTFGVPDKLLTDKGTQFTSDLFKRLCTRFGVVKLYTTPLNPKCNGVSENINGNIKKSLSIFANNTPQWDEYLNYYALLYNSSIHSAIQDKPAYLHLSYDVQLPTDILNTPRTVEQPSYPDFVENKTRELQYTFEKVRDSLIKSSERQEQYQHQTAKYRDFYPGQLVYLYSPDADRNSPNPKKRNYVGPMRIISQDNNVNFTIIDATKPGAKPQKVNSQRLIPFAERTAELDYLTRLILEDKPADQEQPTNLSTSTSKHAVFDEINPLELSFLLPPFSSSQTMYSSNTSFSDPFHTPQDTSSHCSEDTEIYEVSEIPTKRFQDPKPPSERREYNLRSLSNNSFPSTSHSSEQHDKYNLRPRKSAISSAQVSNFADKLFEWGLSLTD